MLLQSSSPFSGRYALSRSVLIVSLHADPTTLVGGMENGGVTVYVRELSHALASEGWEVDVVTRRQSPGLPDRERTDGFDVIRIDAGPPKTLRNDEVAEFFPEARDAVLKLADKRAYRFVSSHYWLSGILGETVRHETGAPHVHTLHSHGIERKKRDPVTLERIEAERRLLSSTPIIALSKAHIALIRQRYGVEANVYVIPAGVDTQRFRPGERSGALHALGLASSKRWIGYVGRLAKEKGIEDLLHAFSLLHIQRPDVGLFVVGGSSGRARIAYLAELAERLHIADVVRFIGPIENLNAAWAFQGADVIAVPSHYEAFGLVALEARACGVPIISSDVGGLRDLVAQESGGARVPPRDRTAWARALAEVLRPDELRRRKDLAIQYRGDEVYPWSTIAKRIASVALSGADV